MEAFYPKSCGVLRNQRSKIRRWLKVQLCKTYSLCDLVRPVPYSWNTSRNFCSIMTTLQVEIGDKIKSQKIFLFFVSAGPSCSKKAPVL